MHRATLIAALLAAAACGFELSIPDLRAGPGLDAQLRGDGGPDLAPPWDGAPPPRDGVLPRADLGIAPSDATRPPVDTQPPCGPEGLVPETCATSAAGCCDPLALTGCGAGVCYMTNLGPGCACTAGTLGIGAECTGSPQCLPGYGCTDSDPPTGTSHCRQICQIGSACADTRPCAPALDKFPTIGVCP